MKSKLIVAGMFIITASAFISCESNEAIQEINDNTITESNGVSKDLIDITIDNYGDVHNYLLEELEKDSVLYSDNIDLGDVLEDMQYILENSTVYSTESNINTGITTSLEDVVDLFDDIVIDEDFSANFKSLFEDYIQDHPYLDDDIITAELNSMSNYELIDTESLNTNMVGYTSVLMYNNVYQSSYQYWTNYGFYFGGSSKQEPDDATIVWVDAAGAILGGTCTWGTMAILMGAAFSHAYIRSCELSEEYSK